MKGIKPSELIRLAIHDLEIVEANPKYGIDMSTWHSHYYQRDQCFVCLAGAVMAVSLKAPYEKTLGPSCYVEQQDLLLALDSFRSGDIRTGLSRMGVEHGYIPNWVMFGYNPDPGHFKRRMLSMADYLEKLEL